MTHPVVFRRMAIPLPTFDYLKNYQRAHEARHGVQLTLAQALAAVAREHQLREESEVHARISQSARHRP